MNTRTLGSDGLAVSAIGYGCMGLQGVWRFSMLSRSAVMCGVATAGILAAPTVLSAQALKDVRASDKPLVLKAQGSFFVGGEKAEQTQAELGDLGPGGHIAVNQMYVRYMVPQGGERNLPVVMVHGATLTGKSWETTPDGRMGWDEYFVRNGHPVYVPDQVGRGRSGFNQAVFNNVRAGAAPANSLPRWLRFSDEGVWPNFRFGLTPGQPFSDSQFPVTAVDELSKQGVPDVSFGGVPTPNPTLKALADLAAQVNGAVLMGHSQSGVFPLQAALLNPTAMKGLVLVEPGSCPATFTDDQIKTLATVPILVVFGDHRDTPTGLPTLPTWQARYEMCQALIGRVKSAGGQAQMLSPAESSILRGNSHMLMQDRNNLQIADLILKWIDERVSKRAGAAARAQAPSIAKVDSGELQGVAEDGIISFKGIPFAAPPVGDLRWRPPQPAAKWTGVRQATEFGADCMQGRFGGPPPGAAAVRAPSEDCLYLNVWRPADLNARRLPVMVWIYGGGFTGGSSSSPNTSGAQFARQGVVLVAMNYRVGRFGFFAFPALSEERPDELKGNYAYMDQIAALQWVKRNIEAFGGNPDNVTIFGFSAGGVSVHSMLASPLARGLFHKAIVESGGSRDSVLTARPMRADGADPNYPVSAETIGINFARSMAIEGTDPAALASLRALSADQIVRGAPPQPEAAPPQETTPILDGKLITETAENAYKAKHQPRVPLLLGSNSADTAGNRIRSRTKEEFFARYGQWSAEAKAAYDPDGTTDFAAMVSQANDDFGQAEPARFAASAFAANGSPVYLYRFSYVQTALRERMRTGAPHGGEIGYVFGTLSAGRGGPPSAEDLAVSRMAQGYWVNFARTGDPNGAGLPVWPRHDPKTDLIFDFRSDGSAGAGPDPRKARLDVTQKATDSGKRADF